MRKAHINLGGAGHTCWQNKLAGTLDSSKKSCRRFYLSIKEVMIKHVIMTEFILRVKLGISGRGKEQERQTIFSFYYTHRFWLVMGFSKLV